MPASFLPCITTAAQTRHAYPRPPSLPPSLNPKPSLPPSLTLNPTPLQVSSLLRRFNNLFGIPSRIRSLVAEGDLQQVWG